MKNSVQDKLQALFANYAHALPGKIEALQQEWQRLSMHAYESNLTQWEDFHRNVHSLCGSSAIYGYDALSKKARQLEMILKQIASQPTLLNDDIKTDITTLLSDVVVAAKQAPVNNTEQVMQTLHQDKQSMLATTNRVVYVLDKDSQWTRDIKQSLEQTAYIIMQIPSMQDVPALFEGKQNIIAFIVNISQLTPQDVVQLSQLIKNQTIISPIICIAEDGDLLTRLKAVRCGGKVFFPKPVEAFELSRILDQFAITNGHEAYRVLIVDDSVSLSEYYALILQEAGMVTSVLNKPMEIMRALNEFQPDLILMDLYMPNCSGLELATVLRQQPYYTSLPIVFLSTEDDKFKQVSALSVGGDDFLSKPVQPQHLVAVIHSRIKRAGVLNSYMMRDGLTGLLNHTTLFQELDLELARAQRNNTTFSFVMLDLDHFKIINDTYGHLVGDHVLRKLSEFLVSNLRKTDVVGRYGGEEFAIILPCSGQDDAIKLMNELREKFSSIQFKSHDAVFNMTFSAGIVVVPRLVDAESIVAAADKALYLAKSTGRNAVALSREKF